MKLKTGKIYHIHFLDHSLRGELGFIEAFGRVISQTKDAYTFAFWDLPFSPKDIRNHNQETFVIIKGTIKNAQEIPELS